MKNVALLGSTGSIGRQALDVIAGQDHLRVVALSAGSNARRLAEQANAFSVDRLALADSAGEPALRQSLDHHVDLLIGPNALETLVESVDADIVLSAVMGSCGVRAALKTVERGLDLAIANKETLVVAGLVITETARRSGSRLLPVDSEHAAIHQCLSGYNVTDVSRIIITASGGPFRTWSADRIRQATVAEALNHPTWDMGQKITIDSATMMNKALEVIEAHWLFGLSEGQIDVVVHPESIIHSMVEFRDGNILAQMGWPDMKLPIAHALNYPDRPTRPSRKLDLAEAGSLTFYPLDEDRFRAISLARRVLRQGRGAGAVLNGANEAAVEAFLHERIGFADITRLVEETLNKHAGTDETDVEALLAADAWAREQVRQAIAVTS